MSEFKYPTDRPAFYAQKVIRKMMKHHAVDEIGQSGVLLVMHVAAQEDVCRYKRVVSFTNDALLGVIGLKKFESLAKARNKAIKSGWLRYKSGTKHKPGMYFTAIPKRYLFADDMGIDEGQYPSNGYREGYEEGYKRGYQEGYQHGNRHGDKDGYQEGYKDGDQGGEHTYPSPNPFPNPSPVQSYDKSGEQTQGELDQSQDRTGLSSENISKPSQNEPTPESLANIQAMRERSAEENKPVNHEDVSDQIDKILLDAAQRITYEDAREYVYKVSTHADQVIEKARENLQAYVLFTQHQENLGKTTKPGGFVMSLALGNSKERWSYGNQPAMECGVFRNEYNSKISNENRSSSRVNDSSELSVEEKDQTQQRANLNRSWLEALEEKNGEKLNRDSDYNQTAIYTGRNYGGSLVAFGDPDFRKKLKESKAFNRDFPDWEINLVEDIKENVVGGKSIKKAEG